MVNYLIVPLFAFANAGIYFGDMTLSDAYSGVSLAIICGLVLGKFLGIFSFSWLTIKCGLAPMPSKSNWKMLAAVSVVGGIGFTVSLFIANLSFGTGDPILSKVLNDSKLGILLGSILAGVLGYIAMNMTMPKEEIDAPHEQ